MMNSLRTIRFFPMTAWGRAGLEETCGALTALRLPGTVAVESIPPEFRSPGGGVPPTALLAAVFDALERYLAGARVDFTVFPVAPAGTAFQQRVREQLRNVPYGVTVTYGELARRAGSPGGARAAGQAVHHNPLPILIPCHRVIGANGEPGGFADGLALKRRLLALEGIFLREE